MLRFKILVLVGGLALAHKGCQELEVSYGTSPTPVKVELEALEQGEKAPDKHLEIGSHWALYRTAIYSTRKGRVEWTMYPIISKAHPFFQELDDAIKHYGDVKSIPEDAWPKIGDFKVLVKTKEFYSEGAIPKDSKPLRSIKGLLINRIESLSGKVRRLIQKHYPDVNPDRILILETGRKPGSSGVAMLMFLAGVAVALGGAAWLAMGAKQPS